jgi:hypothetical protein
MPSLIDVAPSALLTIRQDRCHLSNRVLQTELTTKLGAGTTPKNPPTVTGALSVLVELTHGRPIQRLVRRPTISFDCGDYTLPSTVRL